MRTYLRKLEPKPKALTAASSRGLYTSSQSKVQEYQRLLKHTLCSTLLREVECESCCEENLAIGEQHLRKPERADGKNIKILTAMIEEMPDYPTREAQQCGHTFSVCKACAASHISALVIHIRDKEIEKVHLNNIPCLDTFEEVKKLADPEMFPL